MIELYVTLDYELFLGRKTGTPDNCLIRPMKELCSISDKIGFKYIIFVDAAYLLRMYQLKDQCPQLLSDYNLVESHIKQLAENGHDIQLHFHPQWLYSTYNNNNNEWNLDIQHYKLSDMEVHYAFESFAAAKNHLDEMIGYKTNAFRAGGYCLDSFTEFRRLFHENGIIIDSSVARKMCENNTAHRYDYRCVPEPIVFKFSSKVTEDDANGEFTELSINSVNVNIFKYFTVVRKLQKTYNPTIIYKDGQSINSMEKATIYKKIAGLLKGKKYLASIDGISSTMLPLYLGKEGDNKCVLIGHPKNATDASISGFNEFLVKNASEICFKTTKDLIR